MTSDSGGLISASKRALGAEASKVSEGTESPEAKFDTGPRAKSAAVKADKFPRLGKDVEDLNVTFTGCRACSRRPKSI